MSAEEVQAEPVVRRLLRVEQVAIALGIGKSTAWVLVRSGALVSVRINDRRLVPVGEIDAYIARLTAEQHPTVE
jgi:predicted DNA-binding transcriptional regulator AlpA